MAGKLQAALGGTPYLDEHIELSFRMGIASLSPDEIGSLDPVDFMGRAETALAVARQPGSARVCTWRDGAAETAAEPLDRLRHAFTGDQDRDYRNMGLLWDTVGLLASSSSPLDLVKRVTQQLRRALSASMVSFFEPVGDSLELRYALGVVDGTDVDVDPSTITTTSAPWRGAPPTRTPVWTGPMPGEPGGIVSCAVPSSSMTRCWPCCCCLAPRATSRWTRRTCASWRASADPLVSHSNARGRLIGGVSRTIWRSGGWLAS